MNMNLTMLGQLISFSIFVWFCMRYVWPPILAALEEREAKIADGLEAAERGKRELEAAGLRAEEARREGADRAKEALTQAEKRADEIIEAAKQEAIEEANRVKAAAEAEIEQNRNRAREELRQDIGRLVAAGAEQILMREVDRSAHREVLEKLVQEL